MSSLLTAVKETKKYVHTHDVLKCITSLRTLCTCMKEKPRGTATAQAQDKTKDQSLTTNEENKGAQTTPSRHLGKVKTETVHLQHIKEGVMSCNIFHQ